MSKKKKEFNLDDYRGIGHLRPGYKSSSKKWKHDGDFSGSFQTDHWDGRQDATITPKSVKVKSGTHGSNKEGN